MRLSSAAGLSPTCFTGGGVNEHPALVRRIARQRRKEHRCREPGVIAEEEHVGVADEPVIT